MLLDIVNFLNHYIWGYLLIYLLIGIGIYYTIRLRLIQVFHFGHILNLIVKSRNTPHKQISSFQALCTSLGARVGAGNIAGVGVAIYLGGPGAIFWMWITAIVGMATAYAEGVLAQLYKEKGPSGTYIGGPAYYIRKGLNSKFWAICFSVSLIITFGLIFNAVQANTMEVAVTTAFDVDKYLLAGIFGFFTAVVILGGIVRISKFSEYAVPLMAIAYIVMTFIVIGMNISAVPAVFGLIFKSAFGIEQAGAGLLGYGIMAAIENGVKRGLFSNEAGLGSAANAAATAAPLPQHPASQGYIQMFGVCFDTIFVCTCTAMIILLAGLYEPNNGLTGAALTQQSLAHEIGHFGLGFLAVMLVFFCFTTIVACYSYAESNVLYLTRNKTILNIFRVLAVGMVMFGAISQVEFVWSLADLSMAVMAVINLVAILLLSKVALRVTKDYQYKLKNKLPTKFQSDEFEAWK